MRQSNPITKMATGVQAVVAKQIRAKINSVMHLNVPESPKSGWIRIIREALGMSGAQLGARLKLSRNKISILERKEADGTITLNQLEQLAEGLNADIVYAVIPRQSIEEMLDTRSMELAKSRVNMSHQSMFLEAQELSQEKKQDAIKQLADEIKGYRGKALWKADLLDHNQ
jgi:predicted DNA-binding mobile mystery protein A